MPSITVTGSGSCKAFDLKPKDDSVPKLYNVLGTQQFLAVDTTGSAHVVDFSNAATFASSSYSGITSNDFLLSLIWGTGLPAVGSVAAGSTLLRAAKSTTSFNSDSGGGNNPTVALAQPETFASAISATTVIFTYNNKSFVYSATALPGFSTPVQYYLLDTTYSPTDTNSNKTKYICTANGTPYNLNNGLPDMTKVVSFPVVSALGTGGVSSLFQTVTNVFKGPNVGLIAGGATGGAVGSINSTTVPMTVPVDAISLPDGTSYPAVTYSLITVAPTPDPETFNASNVQTIALSQYSDSSSGKSWAQVDTLAGTIANGYNDALIPGTVADIITSGLGNNGTSQYIFSIKNNNGTAMTITTLNVYCTSAGDAIKFNYYIGGSSITDDLMSSRPGNLSAYAARFKANGQLTATSVAFGSGTPTPISVPSSGIAIPQGQYLNAFVYGNTGSLFRFTSTTHNDTGFETNIGSSIGQNIMFKGGPRFATNITATSIDTATSKDDFDYTQLRFPYISFVANPGGAPYIAPTDIKYLGVKGTVTATTATYSGMEFKNFFQFVPSTFAQFNIFPLAGGDNAKLEDAGTVFLMTTFDSSAVITLNQSGVFTAIPVKGGLFKQSAGAAEGTTFATTSYNGGWQFASRSGGGNLLVFSYDPPVAAGATAVAPTKFYLQKDGTFSSTLIAAAQPMQCNYCSPFGMCST